MIFVGVLSDRNMKVAIANGTTPRENHTRYNTLVICAAIGNFFYIEALWIFCYRYWENAELLAKLIKGKSICT